MLNLPSMAVSIGYGASEEMRAHLAEQALIIMDYILRCPMPRLTFCNLNGPAPRPAVKPAKIRPSARPSSPMTRGAVNPGVKYFWLQVGVRVLEPEAAATALLMDAI